VQADVYALGVVLHELISNRLPFDFKGKDTEEIRRMILEVRPTPPSKSASRQLATRSQWQDLDAICAKALSKDPGGRYGSAEASSGSGRTLCPERG
jgi:serine/threonine protein kinase